MIRSAMLVFLSTSAHAGSTDSFSIYPPSPRVGDAVSVRVDSSDGCYGADAFQIVRNGQSVDVLLYMADFACVLPDWATPRFFPLGVFPAGNYTATIRECPAPPFPCTLRQTSTFTVSGQDAQARRATIPTLSGMGVIILFVAVGCVAWAGRHRAG